jgi:hypothetical protein
VIFTVHPELRHYIVLRPFNSTGITYTKSNFPLLFLMLGHSWISFTRQHSQNINLKLEVLMVLSIMTFWDVMVDGKQHFWGKYFLHLQGWPEVGGIRFGICLQACMMSQRRRQQSWQFVPCLPLNSQPYQATFQITFCTSERSIFYGIHNQPSLRKTDKFHFSFM